MKRGQKKVSPSQVKPAQQGTPLRLQVVSGPVQLASAFFLCMVAKEMLKFLHS